MTPLSSSVAAGGMLGQIIKIIFGLLLSILSWSGIQLCNRVASCEQDIVSLKIVDATRGGQMEGLQRTMEEVRADVKKLLQESKKP